MSFPQDRIRLPVLPPINPLPVDHIQLQSFYHTAELTQRQFRPRVFWVIHLEFDVSVLPALVPVSGCQGVDTVLIDQRLEDIPSLIEEFIELGFADHRTEFCKAEDEIIRVGDMEGVVVAGKSFSLGTLLWCCGGRYRDFERFEVAVSWVREREGLIKVKLGKEKAVCD